MTTRERYLTTVELAERTGKTSEWWARLCNSQQIEAVKLGNDWRVAESVFERFMRGGAGKVAAQPGRTKTARQARRSA